LGNTSGLLFGSPVSITLRGSCKAFRITRFPFTLPFLLSVDALDVPKFPIRLSLPRTRNTLRSLFVTLAQSFFFSMNTLNVSEFTIRFCRTRPTRFVNRPRSLSRIQAHRFQRGVGALRISFYINS
jgi:hypothetical protein